jgi:hypothetical protein
MQADIELVTIGRELIGLGKQFTDVGSRKPLPLVGGDECDPCL